MMRLILALLLTSSLFAQSPSGNPQGVENIYRLLTLTGGLKEGGRNLNWYLEHRPKDNRELDADDWQEISKRLNSGDLGTRIVALYFQNSPDDIKAWIAFFESKPGQAYLASCGAEDPRIARVALDYLAEVRAKVLASKKLKK